MNSEPRGSCGSIFSGKNYYICRTCGAKSFETEIQKHKTTYNKKPCNGRFVLDSNVMTIPLTRFK